MNERIQKLAEHAGLKVESWMTNPPKPFQILGSTEQFEKFAESIVSECVKVAMRSVGDDEPKEAWYLIQEHFGVEE